MAKILSFTRRIFEHEKIEASDKHRLLDAYLKNFFYIKINGNNSTDNYNSISNARRLKFILVIARINEWSFGAIWTHCFGII